MQCLSPILTSSRQPSYFTANETLVWRRDCAWLPHGHHPPPRRENLFCPPVGAALRRLPPRTMHPFTDLLHSGNGAAAGDAFSDAARHAALDSPGSTQATRALGAQEPFQRHAPSQQETAPGSKVSRIELSHQIEPGIMISQEQQETGEFRFTVAGNLVRTHEPFGLLQRE